MNKLEKKSIYDIKQNQKNKLCIKISLPYDLKYLENLSLICQNTSEIIDGTPEINSNYKAESEKLYCYKCDQHFEDYHEMRRHQWTRNHQIKSGYITINNDKVLVGYDDDSSDMNDQCNDQLTEEVDDENFEGSDSDQEPSDTELMLSIDKFSENYTNLDYINELKTGKLLFSEVCSIPTIYFQNSSKEIIGIKRCMLFNKKNKPENQNDLMSSVTHMIECKKIAVFLYSGGCFAGAIFEGNKQILHKTIKRYTCRRQQGGYQTSKDNQGGICKSGGAYLRRVNTKKLIEDVFQLLHQTWANDIGTCGLILVWSAKSQRHIFGHESQLNQIRQKLSFDVNTDPRIRFISARVAKVNNSSLIDVYRQISTIEVYDADSLVDYVEKCKMELVSESRKSIEAKITPIFQRSLIKDKFKTRKRDQERSEQRGSTLDKTAKNEIDKTEMTNEHKRTVIEIHPKEDEEIRTKVLNYVLNDSAEDLVPYFNELKLVKSSEEIASILSIPLKTKNQSLLHLAVHHNSLNVISHLLQFGCNPVHKNIIEETAYAQAIRERNKAACNIMSEYMFQNPTHYDYHAAKFPGGKDPLKEEQKLKQLAEKKKQSKKDRKQRMKVAEEERKKENIERAKVDHFLGLDNASKLSYLKQMERDLKKRFLLCFHCALNISDIVPFSYSYFHFCGMDCLKKHRLSNEK